MTRKARQHAESGIYHVMLRGVNKDAIFLEDADREHFLRALALTRAASGCSVLAYCLMPNHVHLVIRTGQEPIGTVMKRLGVRYSWRFNHTYGRTGHVFQDRFLSRPVETDEYLSTLLRYVWGNPVEAGLVSRPEEYRWSSRRLFGTASALVDHAELAELLPPGWLDESADPSPQPEVVHARTGRPRRHTADEVSDLLERACGADGVEEFGRLSTDLRISAVHELRTRGVSYAQIAEATGLSATAVRRLQAGGGRAAIPVRENGLARK